MQLVKQLVASNSDSPSDASTPGSGKGFRHFGLLKKDPEFALAVYVGFLTLLRGCEIFNLALTDCQPRGPNQLCLILRDTKGARLRNVEFETVTIKDPLIIKKINKCKVQGRVRLFMRKTTDFYKRYQEAVSFFGLVHPKATPHASGVGVMAFKITWIFRPHRGTRTLGVGWFSPYLNQRSCSGRSRSWVLPKRASGESKMLSNHVPACCSESLMLSRVGISQLELVTI